tara:strand:+ start:81 stop:584 length:504 start_codon:yes stop_codon:yes gene_type:complete
MSSKKFKKLKFNYIFILLIVLILYLIFFHFITNSFQKEKLVLEPLSINLLTSVHPNLAWNFKPTKSKIFVKPGEVATIEYIVENFGKKESTGIATFAYFPNQLGTYISKINCFCYDAQTLKPNQKNKFILVILIDPEVTKDSKTKDLKEATIQFTFFDFKEYKENKS